jgi:CO/xanthine dehydrogenase FAD-binding subunit
MVHLRQAHRGRRPPAVINVKRIPGLAAIDVTPSAVRLGAATTLAALVEHPVIAAEFPVLPFAARYMGSPAIRNLATVGGNLCNASPAADLPPALLVLDATAGLAGPRGERRLPLERFFRGPGQPALEPGELLAWVEVPRRPGWRVRYERLDVRRAMDIAIVGVALGLRGENARPTAARLALGAVAPTPLRVPDAEAALVAGGLAPEAIERAAALAAAAARPISDVRATAGYRRDMVAALVRRGLAAMAGTGP